MRSRAPDHRRGGDPPLPPPLPPGCGGGGKRRHLVVGPFPDGAVAEVRRGVRQRHLTHGGCGRRRQRRRHQRHVVCGRRGGGGGRRSKESIPTFSGGTGGGCFSSGVRSHVSVPLPLDTVVADLQENNTDMTAKTQSLLAKNSYPQNYCVPFIGVDDGLLRSSYQMRPRGDTPFPPLPDRGC